VKDGEVNQLSLHAMAMKKVATKVVASNRRLKGYVIDIRASAGDPLSNRTGRLIDPLSDSARP